MKKTWVVLTIVGGLIMVPSTIATIAIGTATGEPCETEEGPGTCSNDPRVLYGMVPLLIGGAMFGVGLWRWIATSAPGAASAPGRRGGVLMGGREGWADSSMSSVTAQYNVPGAANSPPSPPPPDLAGATGAPPSAPPEER